MARKEESEVIQDSFINIINHYAQRIGEQISSVMTCAERIKYIQDCDRYGIQWQAWRDEKTEPEIVKVFEEMKKAVNGYETEIENMNRILGKSKKFIDEVMTKAREEAEKAQKRIDEETAAEEKKRS